MKSLFSIFSLIISFLCYSQDNFECNFRTYINNDHKPLEKIEFYVISNNDTLKAKISGSTIVFPKTEGKFKLEIRLDDQTFSIDEFPSTEFNNTLTVVAGKINKLKKLSKLNKDPMMFMVDEIYPLNIVNPENVREYVYCMFEFQYVTPDNKKQLRNRQYGRTTKTKK